MGAARRLEGSHDGEGQAVRAGVPAGGGQAVSGVRAAVPCRELASEVFEYIEAFFNRTRRHSTLGYLSPEQFETDHQKERTSINSNG